MKKSGNFTNWFRYFLPAVFIFAGSALPAIAQINPVSPEDMLLDNGSNPPYVWKFDNATVTVTSNLGTKMPSGSHIAGVGAFGGDGLADVLWTSSGNGGVASLWMMTPAGPTTVSLAQYGKVPGKAWIGDFTGEGNTQILWGMGSAAPMLWTMNGSKVTGNRLLGYDMPAGMHIVGVGDFNGTGITDIVWSGTASGGTAMLWMMTPNGPVSVSLAQYGAVSGRAWVGSFSGSGKSDILWDMGSDAPVLWTMNGAVVTNRKLLGSAMPAGWHIVGTGNFSGNGLTDIVWSTLRPRGPIVMRTITESGPVDTDPLPGARMGMNVWGGTFLTNAVRTGTAVASAIPSGMGVIQGHKIDQDFQPFVTPGFPGAALSIRAYAPPSVTISNSQYMQTFGNYRPNYHAILAPGDYEVGMQVPDGYKAAYSLCNNCVQHPADSYHPYGGYNSKPLVVTVGVGQTIDLVWKFIRTENVLIANQTTTGYQILPAEASANDLQNLSEDLTCNVSGVPDPLAATDSRTFDGGTNAWVNMGINRKIGSIGVSLSLINPAAADSGLQIIDARSAGGAAWQSTVGIVSPQLVNGMHPVAHYNQSAGNSAELWGFASPIQNGALTGIIEKEFTPLFSNDIEPGIGAGGNVPYSPCYHSGIRFGNGNISFKPTYTNVTLPNNVEKVLTINSQYLVKAVGTQDWYSGSTDEQALYMLRHAARLGNLKIYFLAFDGKTLLGPVSPYDPFAGTLPFPVSDVVVVNCPANPADGCMLKTRPTRLAVLVWDVAGKDIAMAIHGTNQISGIPSVNWFTGIINLKQIELCNNAGNDDCGNLQWHTVFEPSGSGTFQAGQGIDQSISYDFGSPAAISAMNGINLPQ